MEIVGHNRSSSSSSLSSFDSCSDILGLFGKSSHGLAQTKERQQDDGTLIERIPAIDGDICLADAKHVKVSKSGSGSSSFNQDEGLVEGLIKQEGSLQTRNCDDEEVVLSIEAHGLDKHTTELSTQKGAHISSPTCSPPSDHKLSSSSLVLSKKDALLREAGHEASDLDHVNQGHNHILNLDSRVSSGLEADDDLQQLENSIKFFDLYQKTASLSHPLHSTSSWCGSPDLKGFEQIDSADVVCRKQSYARSLSSGEIRKDRKFASASDKKLKSASMHPWLNYEESRETHSRHKGDKDEVQSVAHKKRLILVNSESLGGKTGSNESLPGWKEATLAQALYDKEDSGQSMIDEELFGKTQVKSSWKNSRLEKKSVGLATSESNDFGPDELFRYLEYLDVNEAYVDAIMDIKNPLLNLDESKSQAASYSTRGTRHPSRDGSLSSSTSGLHILPSNCILSGKDIPFLVDSVELIGARQRRGGSSLWERMMGVKDHTVYCIKVVSGKHEWEVLRRYRDFMNFYQQLKRIFDGQSGTSLLSLSEEVENGSRKVFGNTSPNVVEARTFCIEKFLQSLLQAGPPFSTAAPFFWFLRPPQGAFEITGFEEHLMVQASTLQKSVDVQLGTLDSPHLQSPSSSTESSKREQSEDRLPIIVGKTIKLVLTIHQNKSLKQVLYAQHYSCAGCYKHLENEKGLIQGFAQAFKRGKPRFCEYTGQLFCSSCHLNEFAVLPAHVLWHWDFTPRRVSQLAKAYLDSIYDQPLLCVSTANPYLYQRVSCLCNVKETRKKLSRVLSCMRCPSHARILQIMGSRRYLLENNDFFTLRDLEDLSKGAFAVLPGLLTAVLKTLILHVTKQCSVCQDTGEWCGAGILCEDPFHPIFPFNEEENVVNCKVCDAPFHRNCIAKCSSCPSCPKDWVDMKHKKPSGKN